MGVFVGLFEELGWTGFAALAVSNHGRLSIEESIIR